MSSCIPKRSQVQAPAAMQAEVQRIGGQSAQAFLKNRPVCDSEADPLQGARGAVAARAAVAAGAAQPPAAAAPALAAPQGG